MSPMNTALKIISTIENKSFILYVYYCHLNHLFCQILVGTVDLTCVVHVYTCVPLFLLYGTCTCAHPGTS